MASQQTTLCVVNFTNLDMKDIKISEVDSYDWEGKTSRPDSTENFQNTSIVRDNSRCQREEVNVNSIGSPYRMTITFSNGTNLSFRNDQKDAFTKHNRIFDCQGTATNNIEVYQASGGDSNTMYIRSKPIPDNSNWMAKLLKKNPEVKLNQLTMPGSHDAGMYLAINCTTAKIDISYLPDPTLTIQREWDQTQSYSIMDQLKAGSRYFDFRTYYNGSRYYLGHYGDIKGSKMGCEGVSLDYALNQVLSFLKNQEDYITDISIIHGRSSGLDPQPDYVKIPLDLNKGTGGEDIYLCYTKKPSQPPITGLAIITGKDTSPPTGYQKINIDLNLGAGSKTDYIYLCYTRQPNANNTVLKDIIIQEGSDIQPPQGYTKINTDLNKGAGGADLFLSYLLGANNPTNQTKEETVILKFSHTMSDSPNGYSTQEVTSSVVKQVKSILVQYLYTSTTPGANLAQTPLKDLKGKVVAVFDSEYKDYYDPKSGIFPYHDMISDRLECNGYQLILQEDGNLVLYNSSSQALWASNTYGKGAVQALMQTDGNFVLYKKAQPTNQPGNAADAVWSTNTYGNAGAYLTLSDNGALAIVSSNGTVVKPLYSGSGSSSKQVKLTQEQQLVQVQSNLTVYDDYSNTMYLQKMRDDQRNKLAKFGGYNHDYLFLLSWTLTANEGTFFGIPDLADVEVMAKAIANPWLPLTIKDIRNKVLPYPNIIYCDFVDPYLCQSIINLNFW